MPSERLSPAQIAELLKDWPDEACDLALELRDFVLEVTPQLAETIAFHALCYYKSDQPHGVIGGNVCMIAPRDDCLHLSFIHGAALPDPHHLLQGRGKAKRHIELRGRRDINRAAFKDLILAANAHDPGVE
ncbi:MAG: DUF1801 domain-containing protein [Planctomycetota bacterium]